MAIKPKKVMILGLDAPIAPRLYKYAREGKLPAFAKLLSERCMGKKRHGALTHHHAAELDFNIDGCLAEHTWRYRFQCPQTG